MAYRNTIFNENEWQEMTRSISLMFYSIAGVDAKIDKKERQALDMVLKSKGNFRSELFKEVLSYMDDDAEKLMEEYDAKSMDLNKTITEVGRILDNKLSHKESYDFKKHLIAIGAFVADASGKFLQRKISQQEEETLINIGFNLNIPVKELLLTKSLDKIVDRITLD